MIATDNFTAINSVVTVPMLKVPTNVMETIRNFYSQLDINSAAQGHYYINNNNQSPGVPVLSGAPLTWAIPECRDIIYVPDLRLVGTKDDIEKILLDSNVDFSTNKINSFFESAYTIDNYMLEPFKSKMAAEIALYDKFRKDGGKFEIHSMNNIVKFQYCT